MNIQIVLIIVVGLVFYISLRQLFKKPEPTEEQKKCNHEWHKLDSSRKSYYFSIYCPKCKLSKLVDECDWNKMQLDKEYEERINK